MFIIIGLSLAALISAIFSGMFGMAGGLLLLATLFAIDFPHEIAIPLHGVIMLISYSSALCVYFKYTCWRALLYFVFGIIPGFLVAWTLIGSVDRHIAQVVIAVIILYLTFAPDNYKIKNPFESVDINMFIAGVLGGMSSLLIGMAGTFISPLYLRKEWDNKTLMGTKTACVGLLQIGKIGTFSLLGFRIHDYLSMVIPMGICVVAGNLLGVYFVGKLSGKKYRFLYKSVLLIAVFALIADVVIDHYVGSNKIS